MGDDIHKFKSAKSFTSWLYLVPNNKISGGRIISSRTPSGKSYLASVLRQAANSVRNQRDHELTPIFKRNAYKKGRITAITATARKLAVIIWNMLTKAETYKKQQVKETNQKTKAAGLKQVERRIDALKLSQSELKTLFAITSLLTD